MFMGSVQFLAGQKRCASLLGNCLPGSFQQRLEDTSETWKPDLKQWCGRIYLGVNAETSAENVL